MLAVIVAAGHLRWSLAKTLPWQGDELPLLVRFTGLCGQATNEAEAQRFTPSLYTFRKGTVRSLRVPDYVFSRKPSPAFLAPDTFHADQVREDLLATRRICADHGCPLEFILKDISTVHYDPERLFEWGRIAMEVATG